MADGFKPKPLVNANLITDFGGIEMTPEFMNDGPARQDYSWTPGFSEQQVARQLAIAAYHRGEIQAKDIPTLDVNCRWYRRATKEGDPDNRRIVAARNEGYVPAKMSDIGKPWLTAMPPGAHEGPDGTIRSSGGDLQLFVAPRETAARNSLRKKMATEELVDGMQHGEFVKIAEQHKASPEVKRSVTGGSTK